MVQHYTLYTDSMFDSDPQRDYPHAEYGGVPCYPRPYNSSHAMLPPPGNGTSFDPCYLPENHGFLQYCNTFVVPSPSAVVFSGPGNQGFQSGHLMHVGQPTQAVTTTPLFDQHSATGDFSWNHAHAGPYLLGGGMEAENMGIHGYQVSPMSGNSSAFMHPPRITSLQCRHPLYHPPPPHMSLVQAQNMDPHLHLASTSHRPSMSISASNPFLDLVPRFVPPPPPNGLRIYEAPRREVVIGPPARQRISPNLRVLLEDEQLAQGEQNSEVGRDWEGFITENLKTRTFVSSKSSNPEDPTAADEEHHFCAICQADVEDQEEIGVIECCHEYHADCIRKWLIIKNACPICKERAIRICKDTIVLDV